MLVGVVSEVDLVGRLTDVAMRIPLVLTTALLLSCTRDVVKLQVYFYIRGLPAT